MSDRQQQSERSLRYLKLLVLLLLAFMVLWHRAPAVMADDDNTGTEASQEGGSSGESSDSDDSKSEDAGGGDIEKPSEGAAVETNKGSATVAEVVKQDSGSGSSGGSSEPSGGSSEPAGGSSGGGEVNSAPSPAEPVSNDPPSVTVTETYTSKDTGDASTDEAIQEKINAVKAEDENAGDKEYKLTESGETIREEDHEKVDDIIKNADDDKKTVTYKQSDKEGEGDDAKVTLTKTTVTKSENAIQKAIDDALKNQLKEDTKYITITVAAGTYDGDITVGSDDDDVKTVLEKNKDFKLYLLGEGSYTAPEEGAVIDKNTIGATSGKDVVVKGGLNINGINTIIAGIYFSLENRIKITGGCDVTIHGTKEDDGIMAVLEGGDNSLKVDTGDGDDTIKVETAKPDGDDASNDFKNVLTAIAGGGNDTVTITQNGGVLEADVKTGDGEDTAEFKAGENAQRSYGEGEDAVSGKLTADLGAGDDSVTVNASIGKAFAEATVQGNEGFNTLNLDGKLNADGKMNESDTSA